MWNPTPILQHQQTQNPKEFILFALNIGINAAEALAVPPCLH